MRKNILRQRRGITLVELTVVMAITAIITAMIVSLSTLISAQVKQNDARADFLANVTSFRTSLQEQFATFDENNTFTVTVDEDSLNFNTHEISFNTYPYIEELHVACNGDLVKIIVKSTTLNQEQSFVLVSRLGATFTRGAGA